MEIRWSDLTYYLQNGVAYAGKTTFLTGFRTQNMMAQHSPEGVQKWTCILIINIDITYPLLDFPPVLGHGCWSSHDMDTLSALVALCDSNPPVTMNSPYKGPVKLSFYKYFFAVSLNNLSKGIQQPSYLWFEMSWRPFDVSVILVLEFEIMSCSNINE